jgi:hypothetical protein
MKDVKQRYNCEDNRCQHTTSGFAKLGCRVTTQTVAGTKTAGDNPDGVWLHPQLRKAAGTSRCTQAAEAR